MYTTNPESFIKPAKQESENSTKQKILKYGVGVVLSFLTQFGTVQAQNVNKPVFEVTGGAPVEYVVDQVVNKDSYRPTTQETTQQAIEDIMLKRMERNGLGKLDISKETFHQVARDQALVIHQTLIDQGITTPTKKDIYKLLGSEKLADSLAIIEKQQLGQQTNIYTKHTKNFFSDRSDNAYRENITKQSVENGWEEPIVKPVITLDRDAYPVKQAPIINTPKPPTEQYPIIQPVTGQANTPQKSQNNFPFGALAGIVTILGGAWVIMGNRFSKNKQSKLRQTIANRSQSQNIPAPTPSLLVSGVNPESASTSEIMLDPETLSLSEAKEIKLPIFSPVLRRNQSYNNTQQNTNNQPSTFEQFQRQFQRRNSAKLQELPELLVDQENNNITNKND